MFFISITSNRVFYYTYIWYQRTSSTHSSRDTMIPCNAGEESRQQQTVVLYRIYNTYPIVLDTTSSTHIRSRQEPTDPRHTEERKKQQSAGCRLSMGSIQGIISCVWICVVLPVTTKNETNTWEMWNEPNIRSLREIRHQRCQERQETALSPAGRQQNCQNWHALTLDQTTFNTRVLVGFRAEHLPLHPP